MGKNKTAAPKAEEQAVKIEETAPVAEVTAPVQEEKTQETAPAPKSEEQAGVSDAIDATFKARPDLKKAFVNGELFFFDERQAKRSLKQYEIISNPYVQEAE